MPNRFSRTREDHATETAEDYVELIHDLIAETGAARSSEIAKRLGVSKVTVSQTLQRLSRAGLVEAASYQPVTLTQDGINLAVRCKERHETVVGFLMALGLDKAVAEADAEGIEHHVSEKTLAKFKEFRDR